LSLKEEEEDSDEMNVGTLSLRVTWGIIKQREPPDTAKKTAFTQSTSNTLGSGFLH